MNLNRTLRQLRNARDRAYPAMYEYHPETTPPPETIRFMTLADAQSLTCNQCGQCCVSEEADLEGLPLRQYAFGAIPEHQWRSLNQGSPLIIPLTASGRPRQWRPSDADAAVHAAFRCAALEHHADGLTRCRLWASGRPAQCDAFPLDAEQHRSDLQGGGYVLLGTTYQRLCTWVEVVLCPDDSVVLEWRRRDGTLRGRLSAARHEFVARVVREAYRDAYPGTSDALSLDGWQAIRASEGTLRSSAPHAS